MSEPRKSILPFAYLLLALVGLAMAASPSSSPATSPPPASTVLPADPTPVIQPGEPYVPGEVIVQYRGEAVPQTVQIPATADVERTAERIEDQAGVEHATPNYIARISGWTPNDLGVNRRQGGRAGGWQARQWNFLPCLSHCGQSGTAGKKATSRQSLGGINALRAWRELRKAGRPGAAGVKVAVLDTGVAYRDYRSNFRRDPDFNPKTFLPGYDFVSRDRIPLDLNGHGTHVTSTIAQATNNRRGLTGIAYGAKIMPVRVMDAAGFGTTANIIKGVRWAARHGARVLSMSINFNCGQSIPPLEEALRYAHHRGVMLVGSSGNKGQVSCPSLPATSPQVISVGGSTESGCVADYSFRSNLIDIVAPGGGSSHDCPNQSGDRPIMQVAMINGDPTWFGIQSGWKGTSMAAAHVAGAAAMVLASKVLDGKKGPSQVRQRLLKTARLPAYARGNPNSGFGTGILNVGRAVNPKVKLP